ncbi:MAG: dephospho-CoA kinase [Eubacteriales bacterium]|nr:dephospho-CoA kinase [Eubacteriales bacterium]
MRVIAVTGGIGSGKSNVAKLFVAQGAALIDADAVSRALTAPNGEALPAIRAAFGEAVFQADGALNRAELGAKVFGDTQALASLNAVMHPMIAERIADKLQSLRGEGCAIALLDVPLLFETGMDRFADAIVCVTAPEEMRIRRICRRDHVTREEALRRIHSQNPAEVTERLADYVLSTDAPYALTRRRALSLWQQILADGPRRPVS